MRSLKRIVACLWLIGGLGTPALAADKTVCVDVMVRKASQGEGLRVDAPAEPSPQVRQALEEAGLLSDRPVLPYLPLGQSPEAYLKRLFEHFVTHEPGFVTEGAGCQQTIQVELYPLQEGWTAFARYSGNGREERVDRLHADELRAFAERAVLALLHDEPISSTINRENVLRADSQRSVQTVEPSHHFLVNVGTQLRVGSLDTARSDGTAGEAWRFLSPMTLGTGYRAKLESWGIEAVGHVGFGTSETALRKNPAGGHVDLGGVLGGGVHVHRYLDPRGLHSFYLGSGASFEALWFKIVEAANQGGGRQTMWSGGLDVDLVAGWEFLRASSLQFYLQAELNLPVYVIDRSNEQGGVKTWLPGLGISVGVMF